MGNNLLSSAMFIGWFVRMRQLKININRHFPFPIMFLQTIRLFLLFIKVQITRPISCETIVWFRKHILIRKILFRCEMLLFDVSGIWFWPTILGRLYKKTFMGWYIDCKWIPLFPDVPFPWISQVTNAKTASGDRVQFIPCFPMEIQYLFGSPKDYTAFCCKS